MKKDDISDNDSKIEFRTLSVKSGYYGKAIYKVHYVVENASCPVMENFRRLTPDQKDRTKDLINRMATNRNYKSNLITYHLKGYSYGEISPKPHRFFFFIKGDNLIFFDYVEKKKNSFDNSFYKNLNRQKERYERAFEEHIGRG